ncbi:YczE/YyaS/YitT family protein [Lysinibacillus piscis]|uniref:Membrane protein YczE n=1 Tax=Lysinibacillus piscis TaxID=2518931 RepID=A0ABQ5NI72_9BACI|nr:YitT family protein [Lysinibacillus sp. KH24]GLC88007.1 putative membrane protein YczE [Lysinibacillus sp. KH24]
MKVMYWRWLFFISGLIVMSLGISMSIKGKILGTSPWDVLHIGLFQNLGLTIGTWSILTGLLIVVTTSIIVRERPKIGTWLNMLLIGSFIDIFNWLLPTTMNEGLQVIYFIVGLFVLSFGCGMYIAPNMGAGPRDTLMMLIVERFGGTIKTARMGIEVGVTIIGWLLGGPVGVGTIAIALLSGYIVQYSLPYCRKILMKCIGQIEGMKPFF